MAANHDGRNQCGSVNAGCGGDAGDKGNQRGRDNTQRAGEETHGTGAQGDDELRAERTQVSADPVGQIINGTGALGNGNQHTRSTDQNNGAPGNEVQCLFLVAEIHQKRDDQQNAEQQAWFNGTLDGAENGNGREQSLQQREQNSNNQTQENHNSGLYLLFGESSGLFLVDRAFYLPGFCDNVDDDKNQDLRQNVIKGNLWHHGGNFSLGISGVGKACLHGCIAQADGGITTGNTAADDTDG